MHPMGLWGALQMGLFECVSVCVKEYWALGSQMSAEQSLCTITSRHLGPVSTASERAPAPAPSPFLCPSVVSSSLSAFPRLFLPTSFLLVCVHFFFYIFSHTVLLFFPFPLSLALHGHIHFFISPSLAVPEHMHFTVFLTAVLLHRRIHMQSLFQLVTTLLSLLLFCLLRFVLLSLVIPFDSCQNLTSFRGTPTAFAIQIVVGVFLPHNIVTWCGHVLHIHSINHHANYCIHGKQSRESYLKNYVLFFLLIEETTL